MSINFKVNKNPGQAHRDESLKSIMGCLGIVLAG